MSRWLFRLGAFCSIALVCVMLWPIVYGGVHTMHDMGEWYVPTRHFYAQCLANGDAFDWIPNIYCGYYLQGDGQVGMYHPVHWLLYRFLSLPTAVGLEMSLGFPVMLAGVFVLLRRWGVGRGPALFGGMIVAYSGYYLRHYEHMNAIQVLAHVPWMLVLIDIALRSPNRRAAANASLGVSVLTISELLIGYPQYFWFSSFTEACYVVCLLPSRPTLGRLAWLGTCKTIGVVGGAVQLLPTADLLSTSVREQMSIEERSSWPWHPFELANLVAPYAFQPKILTSFYPGVVATVLVAWLAARRGMRASRRVIKAIVIIGAVTAVLAFGSYGLLYRLHLELPVIGVFRMPYRYLAITSLAFGVLAAIAMHELVRSSLRTRVTFGGRRFLLLLPATGTLVLIAIAILDATDAVWNVERHGGSYAMSIAGILLLGFAAEFVHRAEHGSRIALGALIVLASVDLGVFGYRWVYRAGVPITLERYVDALPKPPDKRGRVVAALQNQVVYRDLRIDGGYMPMLPDAPYLLEIDEFGERSMPHLRIGGFRWVQDEEVGNAWKQKSFSYEALLLQSKRWKPVDDPLPRARLLCETVVREDPIAATGEINVDRVAVVESPLALDAGSPGKAVITSDRPGAITLDVDAPGRQLLVVSERHRPGWRARIDGQDRPVHRVYGAFVGCIVGPGAGRVELTFAPDSLTRGRFWTLVSLGTILVLAAFAQRNTKNTRRTTVHSDRRAPRSEKHQEH